MSKIATPHLDRLRHLERIAQDNPRPENLMAAAVYAKLNAFDIRQERGAEHTVNVAQQDEVERAERQAREEQAREEQARRLETNPIAQAIRWAATRQTGGST